jgi:hypothetical protein
MQRPYIVSDFQSTHSSGTHHAVNAMLGASWTWTWFGEYQLTNNPFSCIIPLDFPSGGVLLENVFHNVRAVSNIIVPHANQLMS